MVSVSVLIVDDQALVRAGFRMIFEVEPDIEVVGEAPTARGRRWCAPDEPDVILMDIRMPNVDGLERPADCSTAARGPRILILTTFDLDEYVYQALQAGASGFVLKDMPPEQLVASIPLAARGEALLSPSVTKRLIESFLARHRPARRHPRSPS